MTAQEYTRQEIEAFKDGFYGDLDAHEVATGLWDLLLDRGINQGVACEMIEIFYESVG